MVNFVFKELSTLNAQWNTFEMSSDTKIITVEPPKIYTSQY